MVKTLPTRFNPDLMDRGGTRYAVTIPVRRLERLRALLASDEGEIGATATFSRRKDHIVAVGRLRASWPLQCQRCLEPMTIDIDEPYELVFVESDAAARDLARELDPVVLDETGQIGVDELFEDELMLHVPDIPKHEDLALCEAAGVRFARLDVADASGTPDENAPDKNERRNPFDALKDLNLH